MTRQLPPPPPTELAGGRSCDGGHCDLPSIGWRWYVTEREWLPVCRNDMEVKGVPGDFRCYDEDQEGAYVMDIPDDLSGMAAPVPHYRDITAADTARTLPSPIGGILITGTVMVVVTWVPWWCHQLGVWFGVWFR